MSNMILIPSNAEKMARQDFFIFFMPVLLRINTEMTKTMTPDIRNSAKLITGRINLRLFQRNSSRTSLKK